MNRSLVGTRIAIGAALLFAAAGTRLVAADQLPKAETILDRFVEVTGGKAARQKIHNEVTTGSMELGAMGIKGTLTAYSAEPDKMYTEVDISGIGKMKEGSDGTVAWSLSAVQGPHLKEGDEKAQALQAGRFNGDVNWRDVYASATTAGTESVNSKECYKVVLTPKQGKPVTNYYEKESGLLVKTIATAQTAMGEIPMESAMSDYRKEGDILTPHKILQKGAGQEVTITIDSVRYNVDIPPGTFDIPAEVKALSPKQ